MDEKIRLLHSHLNEDKKVTVKKFFDNSVLTEKFGIVYGTLQDPRP